MAVTPATWTPSSWREHGALHQPGWPDAAAAEAAVERPAGAAAARLRRRGARAAGGARRGRRRPGLPAPGRRLRRVVPRLHGDLDPREAEDPAADVGGADLRVGAAARQGRPDRGPVREAALRARRASRATTSCRPSSGTWSTTMRRRSRPERPIRRGWSRPTTSRRPRSTCCAPSRRAGSPT